MNSSISTSSPPWHLWLVGGLLLLWNGLATFDYVATVIRYEPYLANFPEESLAYYFAAPLWMYLMWGVGSVGGFIAAILLLLRQKTAVPVLGLAWVSSVVAVIYSVLNPPPGGGNLVFMTVVLLIAFSVLIYVRWLAKRCVLK